MERFKNPLLLVALLLTLFGLNLAALDYFTVSAINKIAANQTPSSISPTLIATTPLNFPQIAPPYIIPPPSVATPSTATQPPTYVANVCPAACITLINNATSSQSRQSTISIQTSGSTQNFTDWYTIPGSEFTFNKANYSGAKSFYFQTNLSTDSSDRPAYARLYDATDGVDITGSDITSTTTTLAQAQSGQLNPFDGTLTVRVQIKGLNGNLVTIGNSRIIVNY